MEARDRALRSVEGDPTRFYMRGFDEAVAAPLRPVGEAVGAPASELCWVPNATVGINLVARSLMGSLGPGDEVLLTDVEYGAQVILWSWVCRQRGAALRTVEVCGLPPAAMADAVEAAVTPATRIALVSHITSATALRLPVEEVCRRLRPRGVTVIVDGAHAPGHIPLDVSAVGADYYAGNLHKWFGAPRPTAFLHAGVPAQARLDPLVVSWGGTDRGASLASRVHFGGTTDASGWLAVPEALAFHRAVLAPARPAARSLLADAAGGLGDLGYGRIGRQDDDLMMSSFWVPAGTDPVRLAERLLADRVEAIVTAHAGRPVLRVAVAWYTVADEVDRLLASCAGVAGGR
ncbi:MAG: aminotransferase class V-fold PLP-dependent enzyme [Acidimicrobiales bacterium]